MIKTNNKVEKVFEIEIVETLSNLVKISAENKQDALLKAQDMYRSEEIVLYSDDCIDTKFNIFKRE